MEDPVAEIPNIIRSLCTGPPASQRATIETYFTPTASFTHPFCRTGSGLFSRWLIIQIDRWCIGLSPRVDVWVDSVAFDKENLTLYVSSHQTFKPWVVPFYNCPINLVTVLRLTTDSGIPISEPENAVEVFDHFYASKHQRNGKRIGVGEDDSGRGFASPTKGRRQVIFSGLPVSNRKSARSQPAENPVNVSASASPDPEPKEATKRYFIQSQNDLYQTSEWIKLVVPWGIGVCLIIVSQALATFLCVAGIKTYDILTYAPKRFYATGSQVLDENNNKEHLETD